MNKNIHAIDDLFFKGLEGSEAVPPQALWQELDHLLDKDNVVQLRKKYVVLKRVTMVLALLLLLAGIYEIANNIAAKPAGNNIIPSENAGADKKGGNNYLPKSSKLLLPVNDPVAYRCCIHTYTGMRMNRINKKF